MAVEVERDRDRGVAKHLRSHLRMDLAREHQGGGRVAEVVETDPREASPIQQLQEGVVQVGRVQESVGVVIERPVSWALESEPVTLSRGQR
jgi:hypothetical protein